MMQKNPFKFLDSFTKEDRDIFFGRDKETEELHSRVFESKVLIVYGTSGTGKSSLINCGLANKFNDSDWLPVNVRRSSDINKSLFETLSKTALSKAPFDKISLSGGLGYNLEKLLRSVWLDHFKPVFLIFDQFEELFIFGSKEEKNEFIHNIARVIESDIQCRFIFSLREEYLAGVTEFEKEIPSFLSNRIRIEKMTRQNAIRTIEGPCKINGINLEHGFAEALLEKLNPDTPEVELTWLQIYLDKIMKLAEDRDKNVTRITMDLLENAGDVKDILGTFLEEQISKLSDPDAGLAVLKSFVSSRGTKHQITEDEVIEYTGTFGREIGPSTIKELIQKFIRLRILRDKNEDGRYELRHDSLATKIYEKITIVEKELLEVKSFVENALSNYEKRELLLSEEDLKYIAPYEDKLFLNSKSLQFIEESKLSRQRARRRKLNFAIVVVSVIIILLSFFTIWALRERKSAIVLRQMAVDQKDAAVRSSEIADSAKQVAVLSQKKAEDNEKIAIEAKIQSDAERLRAEKAGREALREKTRAEALAVEAADQAAKAENEKLLADQQRILAVAAREEASRLGKLAVAQTLALKSINMTYTPQIRALTAAQAYVFNRDNGGMQDNPVIYEALHKAWTELDSSKHQFLQGSPNEIATLTVNDNTILSADYDGVIRRWSSDGKNETVNELKVAGPVDFIKFSPSGDLLVWGYEPSALFLKRISRGINNKDLELKGHNGLVISAAFSNDGKYFASGGADSLVNIWQITADEAIPLRSVKEKAPVRLVEFCGPDTIAAVTDIQDGKGVLYSINVIDLKGGGTTGITMTDEKPLCLSFNGSDSRLYIGLSSGYVIKLIPAGKGSFAHKRYFLGTAGIDQIVFSKQGNPFAVSGWDKSVVLYNTELQNEISVPLENTFPMKGLTSRSRSLLFDYTDNLISAMGDRSIRVWDTSSESLYRKLCNMVGKNMTEDQWLNLVGPEFPFQKTFGDDPPNNCRE